MSVKDDRVRFISHARYAKTIYRLRGDRKYEGRKDTDYSNGIDSHGLSPSFVCIVTERVKSFQLIRESHRYWHFGAWQE